MNGGGGCIERLGSLWSLRGAAVEPCPAWSEGVEQRRSDGRRRLGRHGGQLSAHTPTDHPCGSLCPQVGLQFTNMGLNKGESFLKLLFLPSVLYLAIGFHGNCVPPFPFLESTGDRTEQHQHQVTLNVYKSTCHFSNVWLIVKQKEIKPSSRCLFVAVHTRLSPNIAAWYIWSQTTNRFPLPPELPHPTVSPFM